MVDVPYPLIASILAFLTIPFITALIAKKIRIPPIVGYIIGGLILGNFFESYISRDIINNFAYFGIVILLFTIGLEVNFSRLFVLKKYIVIGGLCQITFSVVMVSLLNLIFGFSLTTSVLIAIALASSSTTIIAKIIQDKGEENTFVSEVAMGILIFQNIAFIPFLIIFTSISKQSSSPLLMILDIFLAFIKSTVIIILLFYVGQEVIPRIFNRIARISRELLNLFIIIFIFLMTFISIVLNIPILIGVFVAGALVAQTLEHYHIFSEVRPLRDLLAVVFFVFIGVNIKLGVIYPFIFQIALYTFFVILIKFLVVFITYIFLKFHSKTAFFLGSYLFQIDEDAFILMSTLFAGKLISYENYLFIITVVLISLILTPIIIDRKELLYRLIFGFINKYLPFLSSFIKYKVDRDQSPLDSIDIKNHIVICGYGRVGGYIGRLLMMANIPFVAIDYNFRVVEKAKKEGVNIIYGDPADYDILDYSQTDEALVLVIALPEGNVQEEIISNARKLNRNIYIIGRVHRDHEHKRMKDLGINSIIHPEFEASLSIVKKLLLLYKFSKEEILEKIRRLKIEHGFN